MTLSEFYLELQNSIRHCDNCLEFPVQKVEQRNPTFPENLSLSFQLRLGAWRCCSANPLATLWTVWHLWTEWSCDSWRKKWMCKGKGVAKDSSLSNLISLWFIFIPIDSKLLRSQGTFSRFCTAPRCAKSPTNAFRHFLLPLIWLSRASGYAQRDRQQNWHFTCATLPGSQNIVAVANIVQSYAILWIHHIHLGPS